MSDVKKLKPFINGQFVESKATETMDVYNPSTGEVIAKAPCCTMEEMEQAIGAAKKAYPAWSATPVMRRVQILYKVRELMLEHLEELTLLTAEECGKAYGDAKGDVLKAIEATEHAIAAPELMLGESLMDSSKGIDTVMYRESVGVFAGIAPFNFPAMIPVGWMAAIALATGNTMVLKAAGETPMTCLRAAEFYKQAGLPDGVLNVVTCGREEASLFTRHPDIKGITFVGSTKVGMTVYANGAANGKRVQAMCQAKNHALVLEDAPIERTAAGIINAAFGCAGERCMALPAIAVQESIADQLVAAIAEKAKKLKIGLATDPSTDVGPLISPARKQFVLDWIQKGIDEGAKVVLDGRNVKVPGLEKGFFVGPTIFDHVTAEMTVGDNEIFGPVLCVKRVKDFDEGLAVMNANPFANGSVIYTQNGYYARKFQRYTDAGNVGINVGIPVPVGMFAFSGHKKSFFGDLHSLGKDTVRFFTETKSVTSRWFDEDELKRSKVDSWDGTM